MSDAGEFKNSKRGVRTFAGMSGRFPVHVPALRAGARSRPQDYMTQGAGLQEKDGISS